MTECELAAYPSRPPSLLASSAHAVIAACPGHCRVQLAIELQRVCAMLACPAAAIVHARKSWQCKCRNSMVLSHRTHDKFGDSVFVTPPAAGRPWSTSGSRWPLWPV